MRLKVVDLEFFSTIGYMWMKLVWLIGLRLRFVVLPLVSKFFMLLDFVT